jgi:hypothetical protein
VNLGCGVPNDFDEGKKEHDSDAARWFSVMRWMRIREAKIDSKLRTTLEQYGVPVMQQVLSVGGNFRHLGQSMWVEAVRDSVLAWLTEHYDREERKETWQITMEAAVTILVGGWRTLPHRQNESVEFPGAAPFGFRRVRLETPHRAHHSTSLPSVSEPCVTRGLTTPARSRPPFLTSSPPASQ